MSFQAAGVHLLNIDFYELGGGVSTRPREQNGPGSRGSGWGRPWNEV